MNLTSETGPTSTPGRSPLAIDEPTTQVISELTQIVAASRTRWARFAEELHPDLNGVTMIVLHCVTKHGQITATEIAHRLDMDKGMVSRQITRLRELGFVIATPNPEDRRVAELTPTDRAKQTLREMHCRSTEEYRARFASWSEDEIAQLGALLHRFNETA